MSVSSYRTAGLVIDKSVDTVCTDGCTDREGKVASEQEQARHSAADQYAGSGRLTPRRTDTALSVNTQLNSSHSHNNIHDRLTSIIPTSVDFASARMSVASPTINVIQTSKWLIILTTVFETNPFKTTNVMRLILNKLNLSEHGKIHRFSIT